MQFSVSGVDPGFDKGDEGVANNAEGVAAMPALSLLSCSHLRIRVGCITGASGDFKKVPKSCKNPSTLCSKAHTVLFASPPLPLASCCFPHCPGGGGRFKVAPAFSSQLPPSVLPLPLSLLLFPVKDWAGVALKFPLPSGQWRKL